jgi:hypothetical protein
MGGKNEAINGGELAKARGIGKASAINLGFRHRGARKAGNDLVPLADAEAKQSHIHDHRGDASLTISTLENTLALLLEQLHREQRLADEARADSRAERERLLSRIAELEAREARLPLPLIKLLAWCGR